MTIAELRALLERASVRVQEAAAAIEEAGEDADLDALNGELDEAVADGERCRTNLEAAERAERARAAFPVTERAADPEPERRDRIAVTREELTYRPDDAARGRSFFRDAYAAERGSNFEARERLERNAVEQRAIIGERYPDAEFRDVGTGAFTGLVVPQYLVDLVAPLARAGAPLVNALPTKLPLPSEGMTLNVSRITTGTAVAAQATENSAVQETDADDTLLTVNVRTYAGMQDVSRQAIERGTMIDSVIYGDLVRAYWTKLDNAIINDDGTNGTHLGIRSTGSIVAVTYTDASPTVAELYPKIGDAKQQIANGVFTTPTTIVCNPRRWEWAASAVDSSGRPLVVPTAAGPDNAEGVVSAVAYGTVVGTWHALPVLTDANIPTTVGAGTEDVMLVLSLPELLFWREGDGMPRQMRFEQTAPPQSVRLAVWGYTAFTAGRYPGAAATIGGTGLIAPTF